MNIRIIYQDQDIIVCHKEAGIAVQSASVSTPDMVSMLKNELKTPYLGVVHRLDQPVEGVIVFAKNKGAAGKLSAQIQSGQMKKVYEAKVYGIPERAEASLEDMLYKDAHTNTSYVADAKFLAGPKKNQAKKAQLNYRVIETGKNCATLLVELLTGRHHQIRVQLSHMGHPLLGDLKYGTGQSVQYSGELGIKTVALRAISLTFRHPASGKEVTFSI